MIPEHIVDTKPRDLEIRNSLLFNKISKIWPHVTFITFPPPPPQKKHTPHPFPPFFWVFCGNTLPSTKQSSHPSVSPCSDTLCFLELGGKQSSKGITAVPRCSPDSWSPQRRRRNQLMVFMGPVLWIQCADYEKYVEIHLE